MTPRGIRNNNPLNIRRSKIKWQGEIERSEAPASSERAGSEVSFCVFKSPEWGFRAGFCLLRTYCQRYHLTCVRDIISRWAPSNENDTERYIRHVCQWTGFGGNQRLTEDDWPKLLKAMAREETSHLFDDAVILKGFQLFKQK